MNRKPPESSKLLKTWMMSRRDKKIHILPEYHLIVSEGTKTEPNYFQGLKKELNQKYNYRSRGRIELIIEGTGYNTLSLLTRAQMHVNSSANMISHVWLVYDLDSFPKDDFDNTALKCKNLSEDSIVNYHALWSNQCIELWFLLHFAYLQSDVHRDGYRPMLNKYFADIDKGLYEKNRDDIYDILRSYLSSAIINAKRLKEHHNDSAPSRNAPGTNVFELFEILLDYL